MKISLQLTADLDEYPELAGLVENVVRRVAELMQLHDIIELRRIHKTGVFNHPYDKDVVTPIGVQSVPKTVAAVRYATGKALLDYLATIGVSGVGLALSKEEVDALDSFWRPPAAACPVNPQVQEPQFPQQPQVQEPQVPQHPQAPKTRGKARPRVSESQPENQTTKAK